MDIFLHVIKLVLAAGLINVWLVRFNRSTSYRGGTANNMAEEFAAYGLPNWFMYFIGFLKLLIAVLLLAGFWYEDLVRPAVMVLIILMIGAIAMHIKIKDPFSKSIPAVAMLVMSLVVYNFN